MKPVPVKLARWVSLLLLSCLGLGIPSVNEAAAPEELFARGNDSYARGDYVAAEQSYQEILEAGIRNSRVYYNLGNAYFKDNRVGLAILYYERALKLDPTDPEARANLRFANLRIRDRIPTDDLPFLLSLLRRVRDTIRLEPLTRAFLGLYLGSMVLTAGWILARARRGGPALGIAALSLLGMAIVTGGWMLAQYQVRFATDHAIVLVDKVDVLSGPGPRNTLLASVHEGTKVRIHNRREGWMQVVLPDGRAGWVEGNAIELI